MEGPILALCILMRTLNILCDPWCWEEMGENTGCLCAVDEEIASARYEIPQDFKANFSKTACSKEKKFLQSSMAEASLEGERLHLVSGPLGAGSWHLGYPS